MDTDTVVIHASKYGATTRYAQWVGEELGAPVISAEEAAADPSLWSSARAIVVGSGLSGTELRGADLLAQLPAERVVLFTVGLGDPATTDYSRVLAGLPEALRQSHRIFHLRAHVSPGGQPSVISTHSWEGTLDQDGVGPIAAAARALG